ncbi:hypothetical protein PR048_012506 [Dryococelus australis]|uniref:Uncharacterized protein n=1 Tax=Dryococelus australis TaxID=614101 RepID=A0ABQ9HPU8_9NEOP|nr:hypothetical protein PR048_012506 [Dryococelus australis]
MLHFGNRHETKDDEIVSRHCGIQTMQATSSANLNCLYLPTGLQLAWKRIMTHDISTGLFLADEIRTFPSSAASLRTTPSHNTIDTDADLKRKDFVTRYRCIRPQLRFTFLASHQGETGSIPGLLTPAFCKWESCRKMPLVGGFLGDLQFSPPSHSGAAQYTPQSPSSALKTLFLRAHFFVQDHGQGVKIKVILMGNDKTRGCNGGHRCGEHKRESCTRLSTSKIHDQLKMAPTVIQGANGSRVPNGPSCPSPECDPGLLPIVNFKALRQDGDNFLESFKSPS